MKALYDIFKKSIVWNYYRKNVLFLLVVILFAFGFLSGQEHKTIIRQALNSPKLLVYIAIGWLVYAIKTYLFVIRSLNQPEFRFLFYLTLISFWRRVLTWFYVGFMLNQLTFLYAVFMIVMAAGAGKFSEITFILSIQLLLIVFGAIVFEIRIRKNIETHSIFTFKMPLLVRFRWPFFLFYHRYLLLKEPILLLITKLFSVFSLLFFIWLFPTDEYDNRLFSIAAIIISASHLKICSEWLNFQYKYLQFYQNLPLSYFYKILIVVSGYLVLILPELYLILMRTNAQVGIQYILQWVLFLVSLITSTHYFQYLTGFTEETKMQLYFFGIIFLLLLVMYKIPIILLSLILISSSVMIYFKFEKAFETNK